MESPWPAVKVSAEFLFLIWYLKGPVGLVGPFIFGETEAACLATGSVPVECIRFFSLLFVIPCVLVCGGETTVTVRGKGRGRRNAEFLLGLAAALDGEPGIHELAADTDGIDGSEDNAGAICHPDTLARAEHLGLAHAACSTTTMLMDSSMRWTTW